jgi:conjugal transfer/entry exclusion protein
MRLVLVGSKPDTCVVDQCARVSAQARTLMPMPKNTVRPSVHIVERSVRSLVHSDRNSPDIL